MRAFCSTLPYGERSLDDDDDDDDDYCDLNRLALESCPGSAQYKSITLKASVTTTIKPIRFGSKGQTAAKVFRSLDLITTGLLITRKRSWKRDKICSAEHFLYLINQAGLTGNRSTSGHVYQLWSLRHPVTCRYRPPPSTILQPEQGEEETCSEEKIARRDYLFNIP